MTHEKTESLDVTSAVKRHKRKKIAVIIPKMTYLELSYFMRSDCTADCSIYMSGVQEQTIPQEEQKTAR